MPNSFTTDSMMPTDLSTSNDIKPACSLHSIVDRLAGMRKRTYPYEAHDYNTKFPESIANVEDVFMHEDYDNGAQSDSSVLSLTTSHALSTGDVQESGFGGTSRRKSSHPCRYTHFNEEDEEYDDFNDCRTASFWNPSEHIYPSCCKIKKSGRVSRGPISCIVRKLLSEMINTVIATIASDFNSRRSGRRPKLWISSTAHLGNNELQELAEQNLCNISSVNEEAYLSDNQVVDHSPVQKRRRGRPPQLGNPFPSPTSTIPKLISDMMNAICFEVDGMSPCKRRGRPPSSNAGSNNRSSTSSRKPFSIVVRRPRGNAAYMNSVESYKSRMSAMSEEISRQAQTDVLNSFVPLLKAAGHFNADALSSFINGSLPFEPTESPLVCKSEPVVSNETTLNLMHNLPEALSQLVVAQTFQQNVAAAALAAVAQRDFDQQVNPFDQRNLFERRSERGRRGRRSSRNMNSLTHESFRNQQQNELAMRFAIENGFSTKRSRAGRPRGSGRGAPRHSRRGRYSIRHRRSPQSIDEINGGNEIANQQQIDQQPAQNGSYVRYSL